MRFYLRVNLSKCLPGSIQNIRKIESQSSENLLLSPIVFDRQDETIRQRICHKETHPVREDRINCSDHCFGKLNNKKEV